MKKFEVTYRLPTTGTKYHKTIVEADNQVFANKIFEAPVKVDFHIKEWNDHNHVDVAEEILKNV